MTPSPAPALPDLAVCESCRGELLDATNRRYRYPFINCAACGPRASIIDTLPYRRAGTSMRDFTMCHACEREYYDPLDRRYGAEANACPVCGPQAGLWNGAGAVVAERDHAVTAAANAVRAGQIVALKALGGFQLLVDATDDVAVRRLRRRRGDEAPFPVMCPDLECVQQHATLSAEETQLLVSPAAPVVMVPARRDGRTLLASSVASGSAEIGVMLPYTPLHVLLMRDLRRPIVVTAGHAGDNPPCIDERDVVTRLGGIADVFLVHNRRIARPLDESIVRVEHGRPVMLRHARGYL